MDKNEIVLCEVCGAEATRVYSEPQDMALCEYHADQADVAADMMAERQQEDAALDNE